MAQEKIQGKKEEKKGGGEGEKSWEGKVQLDPNPYRLQNAERN